MKIFKEFFEDQEQRVETVALLPGGYKPPTKGHFNALKYLMQDADRAKDVERYDYFEKNIEKYPLVRVVKIPIQSEGISGTKTRELIQQDIEQGIDYFVPEEVITSIQDRQAIEEILTNN